MTRPTSTQRLHVALMVALAGALALGSFWILELMRKDRNENIAEQAREAADYTVENFNFIRLTKDGEARYNIAGRKLTHYPYNDSFEIEKPQLHSLNNVQAPLTLVAERAVVDNAGKEVHLYEKVHLDRPASANAAALTMDSEYLLILPDSDMLKTNKAVRIETGVSVITAGGMVLDNTARRMELTGRVRGVTQASR